MRTHQARSHEDHVSKKLQAQKKILTGQPKQETYNTPWLKYQWTSTPCRLDHLQHLRSLPSACMRSEGTVVGSVCVCVCVCYSTSSVCSSYKGYDLLNGQWRSELSNGFLWNCSVAKLDREKANTCRTGCLTTVWSIRVLCVPRSHKKMQRRACIASRMLSSRVVSPRQTLRELARDHE